MKRTSAPLASLVIAAALPFSLPAEALADSALDPANASQASAHAEEAMDALERGDDSLEPPPADAQGESAVQSEGYGQDGVAPASIQMADDGSRYLSAPPESEDYSRYLLPPPIMNEPAGGRSSDTLQPVHVSAAPRDDLYDTPEDYVSAFRLELGIGGHAGLFYQAGEASQGDFRFLGCGFMTDLALRWRFGDEHSSFFIGGDVTFSSSRHVEKSDNPLGVNWMGRLSLHATGQFYLDDDGAGKNIVIGVGAVGMRQGFDAYDSVNIYGGSVLLGVGYAFPIGSAFRIEARLRAMFDYYYDDYYDDDSFILVGAEIALSFF